MAKLQVLRINQILMTIFGIYPDFTNPTAFSKSFTTYYYMTSGFITVFASVAFVIAHWPDVAIILAPSLVIIAGGQSWGMYYCVGSNRDKLVALHNEYQRMADQAEQDDEEVFKIYSNIEKRCRGYTKFICSIILMNQVQFIMAFVSAILSMKNDNLDTTTWNLPFAMIFPFGHSVWAWFIDWFLEMITGFAYCSGISSITAYFVCSCLYIKAICDHVDYLLESIGVLHQKRDEQVMKLTNQQINLKVKQIFAKVVDVQVTIFKARSWIADIHNGCIFCLLTPNVLSMAFAMYTLENGVLDMVMIAFYFAAIGASWFYIIFYTYFANMISDRITTMAASAYNSNWIDCPPELQRYIILFIAHTQEPVPFTGFGIIYCTMETLGKILRTSFSYYMIFRTMSSR